jgi:transcription elongation GreA/GreB family factor
MTAGGLQRLVDELRNLKSVERPAIIVAIAEARSHGDLSENAEYHAARERQSFIEGRIEELEAVVSAAEVIDPSTLTGDTVKFACPAVDFLPTGQGADRQEEGRHRQRAGPWRGPQLRDPGHQILLSGRGPWISFRKTF